MTLSRRDAIKHTLSATALAGLVGPAAMTVLPRASADGTQQAEANVKDFGAMGDGTTDDTAAIHAARDAAGIGGKVVIAPGIYVVSGLTADTPNQMWELSEDTVIKMAAKAARILTITGFGVSVVGGVFDGANGTLHDWSQSGIEVAADSVTIRNVTAQNSPAFGICAFNRNQITICGCKLIDNYIGGIFVQNSSSGPSSIGDILITDNLVESSAGPKAEGIGVRGDSTDQRVSRVKITQNTVHLPYNQSAETGGISIWNGDDWEIENNVVYGGFLGITCPNSTRAAISDNVVRGFSSIGIEIPNTVDSVRISRNVVDPDGTAATSGIQASAGEVCDLIISGNTISNFSADCYLISFVTDAALQRVTLTANLLTSTVGPGSFCSVYFNGSVTDLSISANTVDGSSRPDSWGVKFLKSVSRASVNGNLFSNLAGGAVLMASSGANYKLDYINAAGNGIVNCAATLVDSTTNGAVAGTNISS